MHSYDNVELQIFKIHVEMNQLQNSSEENNFFW